MHWNSLAFWPHTLSHSTSHHHHHVCVAGEGCCVTPVPWPRRVADLHNVEGMLPVSLQIWSTHLLFGRPGRRFQSRPGRRPSDRSTWAHRFRQWLTWISLFQWKLNLSLLPGEWKFVAWLCRRAGLIGQWRSSQTFPTLRVWRRQSARDRTVNVSTTVTTMLSTTRSVLWCFALSFSLRWVYSNCTAD